MGGTRCAARMDNMGEWMYADFQYEYFNDCSFFEQKSYRAVEGWKSLGRASLDDPLGMAVPGVMEAWRNPTSPAAWRKAAVDIALIGFSAAKIGNAASIGRAGRIGGEIATLGKAENIAHISSISEKKLFNFSSTVAEYMTNPSHSVPIHILQDAIKSTKGVPDPRGSRASMYYTEMWKNGQKFNWSAPHLNRTTSLL